MERPDCKSVSLLAEEIVEEWLRRDGFFTIRGRKQGNHELDLLAYRPRPREEAWHWEVQVSSGPIAYIAKYSSADQSRLGLKPNSAKLRTPAELKRVMLDWWPRKVEAEKVASVRRSLYDGPWRVGFVHGNVKDERELDVLRELGVRVVPFTDILRDLSRKRKGPRVGAQGSDIVEILGLLPHDDADEDD